MFSRNNLVRFTIQKHTPSQLKNMYHKRVLRWYLDRRLHSCRLHHSHKFQLDCVNHTHDQKHAKQKRQMRADKYSHRKSMRCEWCCIDSRSVVYFEKLALLSGFFVCEQL